MPSYAIRDKNSRKHAELIFNVSKGSNLALWVTLEVDPGNGRGPKFLSAASLDADQSAALIRVMRGFGPAEVAVSGLLFSEMTVRVNRYSGGFVFTLSDGGKTLREITVLESEVDKIARNLAFDLRVTGEPQEPQEPRKPASPLTTVQATQNHLNPIKGSPPGAPIPPFPTH